MPEYFISGTNWKADKEANGILIMKIHNDFSEVFTGIGSFKGTFKLQVREDSCLYQAYALQELP